MNISMEGTEYVKKAFDTIENEIIPTRYKDDSETCNFELKKLETTNTLLSRLWVNIQAHFKGSSSWYIMQDDNVCKELICSIAFLKDFDPNKDYEFGALPDDSVTMNVIPELGLFEFLIGNRSAVRLTVIGFNSYGIAENRNPMHNQNVYDILMECINVSVKDCEEVLKTINEPNMSINIGNRGFQNILNKYIEDSAYNTSRIGRYKFGQIINEITSGLGNYFRYNSQWVLINQSRIGEYYGNIFTDEKVDMVIDYNNIPDKFISFNVYFKYTYFEICIGTMRVIRVIVDAMNDVRYEGPDPRVKDHKWCEQIMQIVCDAIDEVF